MPRKITTVRRDCGSLPRLLWDGGTMSMCYHLHPVAVQKCSSIEVMFASFYISRLKIFATYSNSCYCETCSYYNRFLWCSTRQRWLNSNSYVAIPNFTWSDNVSNNKSVAMNGSWHELKIINEQGGFTLVLNGQSLWTNSGTSASCCWETFGKSRLNWQRHRLAKSTRKLNRRPTKSTIRSRSKRSLQVKELSKDVFEEFSGLVMHKRFRAQSKWVFDTIEEVGEEVPRS